MRHQFRSGLAGALGVLFVALASPCALAQFAGTSPQQPDSGGTGLSTITANALLAGNGTGPLNVIAPGAGGTCLGSNGTVWAPTACIGAGSVVGTAPIASSISGGVATISLNIDANFAVVSNNLALANIASGTLLANSTAGSAEPAQTTLTALIDRALGSTRGSILERGASAWAPLAPGTTGYPFISNGSGADPAYQQLSLSAGITGVLPLANGGSNANLTASNGGIVYSTASALAILSGTASVNQVLLSGSSAAPTWSSAQYPGSTTINQLLYSSAANTITGLATGNNGVLVTSSGGVPSISSTIPSATQDNITRLGTVTSGVWNGSLVGATYGGTGVNNGASTITIGGNVSIANAFTASGNFALTLTATAITNSTLPAGTHTLAGLDVAQTWSAVQQFNSGDLKLAGSGTGLLTMNCAATCGTNTITWPAGTTDFSATGGASQVIKQTSSGGAFTVAQLAASDLSNGTSGSGAVALVTSATFVTPTLGAATATSLKTASLFPPSDSTTALQVFKADGSTRVVAIDTTNARVGINKTAGAYDLDVNGAVNVGGTLTFGTLSSTSLGASTSTITGLTLNNSPNAANDYYLYYSAGDGAIRKCAIGSCNSAGASGVTALGGLTGSVGVANGIEVSGSNIQFAAARRTTPTNQKFLTAASGTYTTPANVLWIKLRLVGGGGGGAPSGTVSSAATDGGNTCWNTSGTACTSPVYQAGGGIHGTQGNIGGAGGTVSGSGTCIRAIAGGAGQGTGGLSGGLGGSGGASALGGQAGGTYGSNPVAAAANSGGGGAASGGASVAAGDGGGAGAYCETIIAAPAATYTYTVGDKGAGGVTGTFANGSDGGLGGIWVEEHYNW